VDEADFFRVYSKNGANYLIDDFYKGGQKQMSTVSTSYVELNKIGKTIFYYESGQKEKEGDYIGNKEDGEWKFWYENGQLEEEGDFNEGDEVGFWKGYYEGGALEFNMIYGREGKLEGQTKFWYENGQLEALGKYSDDNEIGEWIGYHENGVILSQCTYDFEGNIDGESFIWHENEKLASKKEYSKGKIVTGGKTFHKNGLVNLVYDYNSKGEKVGDWLQYFSDGTLRVKGAFKLDEKDGDWLENHEDVAVVKLSGSYKKGLKKGDWKYFSKEEKILAVLAYKRGEISDEKYFDKKGEKVNSKEANQNPFFTSYENNNLLKQINLIFELKNDQIVPGKSVISVNLAEDGTILKVYSSQSITSIIDSALVNSFRGLKRFNPGKKYNNKVKYYCDFEIQLNANNTLDMISENFITATHSDIDFQNYSYDDAVFTIVGSMPEFPGETKELFVFLGQNIKYPPSAKARGISGRVYVNFTIRRTGIVSEVKIIKGVHKILDDEALRVVNEMPKWKPGFQRGKPVSVSYNLPINFRLR
jgi:TonB family protein